MIFSFLHRQGRSGRMKATANSLPSPSTPSSSNKEAGNEALPPRFDPIKWARANPWLVEGQADDRLPVSGAVTPGGGTPAEQRSLARRTHQQSFKKWSQARHD